MCVQNILYQRNTQSIINFCSIKYIVYKKNVRKALKYKNEQYCDRVRYIYYTNGVLNNSKTCVKKINKSKNDI